MMRIHNDHTNYYNMVESVNAIQSTDRNLKTTSLVSSP